MLFCIDIRWKLIFRFTAIATVSGYTVAVLLLNEGNSFKYLSCLFNRGEQSAYYWGLFNAAIIHFFKIPSIITNHRHIQYILRNIDGCYERAKWLYGFSGMVLGDFAQIRVFNISHT